jgi:hypothetical protein
MGRLSLPDRFPASVKLVAASNLNNQEHQPGDQ